MPRCKKEIGGIGDIINTIASNINRARENDPTRHAQARYQRRIMTPRGEYSGGDFGGAGSGTIITDTPEYNYTQRNDTIYVPITRTFNDAFNDARRAGLSEFEFNGNRYTTEMGDNPNSTAAGNTRTETDLLRFIRYNTDKNKVNKDGSTRRVGTKTTYGFRNGGIISINGNVKNGLIYYSTSPSTGELHDKSVMRCGGKKRCGGRNKAAWGTNANGELVWIDDNGNSTPVGQMSDAQLNAARNARTVNGSGTGANSPLALFDIIGNIGGAEPGDTDYNPYLQTGYAPNVGLSRTANMARTARNVQNAARVRNSQTVVRTTNNGPRVYSARNIRRQNARAEAARTAQENKSAQQYLRDNARPGVTQTEYPYANAIYEYQPKYGELAGRRISPEDYEYLMAYSSRLNNTPIVRNNNSIGNLLRDNSRNIQTLAGAGAVGAGAIALGNSQSDNYGIDNVQQRAIEQGQAALRGNALERNRPQYYAQRDLPLFEDGAAIQSGLVRAGWSHGGGAGNLVDIPTMNVDLNNYSFGSAPRRGSSQAASPAPDNRPAPAAPTRTTPSFAVDANLDTGTIPTSVVQAAHQQAADANARQYGVYDGVTPRDWMSLAGNVAGSIGSWLASRNAPKVNIAEPLRPFIETPVRLRTRYNNRPQIAAVRENTRRAYNDIRQNTASSSAALSRMQRARNAAVQNINELEANRQNIETQLTNADRMNRQQVRSRNARVMNQYYQDVASARTRQSIADAQRKSANQAALSNLFNNVNLSFQDFLGRMDRREAFNNTLAYLRAANPDYDDRMFKDNGARFADMYLQGLNRKV